MRYYTTTSTLFIRGLFRAASTGISGGIRSVTTLLAHDLSSIVNPADTEKTFDRLVAAAGLEHNYFGLTAAVPIRHACVLQDEYVTVFVTAGVRREPPSEGGGISLIVVSSEGMEDAALLETIMVTTEAKAEALAGMDLPVSGTDGDEVIAACEGKIRHRSAGRASEIGQKIRRAVLHGVAEAVRRHDAGVDEEDAAPAFYIFSRLKGDHWIAWSKKNCPYYPCHFEGQSCDFCYCPFYPCHDESLGQWATGSNGKKVWNCARCRLLHEPQVAAYFRKYPGASRQELMKLAAALKRQE